MKAGFLTTIMSIFLVLFILGINACQFQRVQKYLPNLTFWDYMIYANHIKIEPDGR